MERMYWTHPDVFEAEVNVVNVEPGKVRIDPILFHPDEGGQPADKGTIGDAAIRDVQVVGGEVIHTLDRPLPDGRHIARVDKEHRLHTATQHTAQHILSGIAARQFGLETVGVHIGLEGCTVDFHEKLGWDVAADLERRAMDIVMQDAPVETSFGDPDVQARSRLGPIESDVIRVVSIGDCDVSACCGAHVRTTGRIGVIRIFDLESKKAGTRVSFLAGKKALEHSQAETSVLRRIARACGLRDGRPAGGDAQGDGPIEGIDEGSQPDLVAAAVGPGEIGGDDHHRLCNNRHLCGGASAGTRVHAGRHDRTGHPGRGGCCQRQERRRQLHEPQRVRSAQEDSEPRRRKRRRVAQSRQRQTRQTPDRPRN